MLHLIFQAPLETATLERIVATDAIVFFEDSLFQILNLGENTMKLQQLGAELYVLADDIASRGILAQELIPTIIVIDCPELVNLTTQHKLIQTWN